MRASAKSDSVPTLNNPIDPAAQDIAASNSLAELAARIREERQASALAMKRGLEHAINAGRLLIEAKAQVNHGQWLPWLRELCPSLPERTVQLYMRLALHADEIQEKSATVADLTVRGAVALLPKCQPLPPVGHEFPIRFDDDDDADDDRRLSAANKCISDVVACVSYTIQRWRLDSKQAARLCDALHRALERLHADNQSTPAFSAFLEAEVRS